MTTQEIARDKRAATATFDKVPLIDLAPLQDGTQASRLKIAAELADACEKVGFLYIVNHGIPAETISRMFRASTDFFAQPVAEKMKVDLNDDPNFRGYLPVGLSGGTSKGNQKEGYQVGLDLPLDDPDVMAGKPLHGPNPWPPSLPGFREDLTAYFDALTRLSEELARLFALGLGLPESTFLPFFKKPISQLRLLYYPPQRGDSEAIGSQPHTDRSAFTILSQDEVGGLEVADGAGGWLRATPIDGSFVVNIGEVMKLWSDGRFASTPHRVINASSRQRMSIAYFANPDFDTVVVPLVEHDGTRQAPVLVGHLDPAKAITSGEAILESYSRLWPKRQAGAA